MYITYNIHTPYTHRVYKQYTHIQYTTHIQTVYRHIYTPKIVLNFLMIFFKIILQSDKILYFHNELEKNDFNKSMKQLTVILA